MEDYYQSHPIVRSKENNAGDELRNLMRTQNNHSDIRNVQQSELQRAIRRTAWTVYPMRKLSLLHFQPTSQSPNQTMKPTASKSNKTDSKADVTKAQLITSSRSASNPPTSQSLIKQWNLLFQKARRQTVGPLFRCNNLSLLNDSTPCHLLQI